MNWWNKISNVGIAESLPTAETRRAQLTNRCIFIAIWIEVAYIPLFINFHLYEMLTEIIIVIILNLFLFHFSKKGKHHLGAIFLSLLLISNIIVTSILTPGGQTQLYLIMMSLFGFVMIRNIKSGILIFLYAFVGFFFVLFAQKVIPPLMVLSNGIENNVFMLNIVLIFFACFYLIYHFKLSNEDYERDILLQKEKIENQHSQLEGNLQEIKDSINYAKRIQQAILPADKVVKEYLKSSFILYKPKDIVAGDFYWLEHKNGKVLFAAADCTGHGVPGAMVSVICNNGLNRSVREHNLTDPGKILDKTREIIIQEFEKSEDEVRDGMDIALCSLEGNTLQYAGAHNPLWLIRDGEVIETKANKQPVGKFSNLSPYTTHTIELQKNDSIYIFSDGFVDQFGGEKGKKFKAKAFKSLLLSIQVLSIEKQKKVLDETFENWKGNLEQIDDVCVIGVRV